MPTGWRFQGSAKQAGKSSPAPTSIILISLSLIFIFNPPKIALRALFFLRSHFSFSLLLLIINHFLASFGKTVMSLYLPSSRALFHWLRRTFTGGGTASPRRPRCKLSSRSIARLRLLSAAASARRTLSRASGCGISSRSLATLATYSRLIRPSRDMIRRSVARSKFAAGPSFSASDGGSPQYFTISPLAIPTRSSNSSRRP